MYDLDTIKAMNNESGEADVLGKAMTLAEIKEAAYQEELLAAQDVEDDEPDLFDLAKIHWPEPRPLTIGDIMRPVDWPEPRNDR